MFSLQEEYAQLAKTVPIDWGRLESATVVVTGATGLIGSCCVRLLLERNRLTDAGIRVIAMVRNEAKAADVFKGYGPDSGLEFLVADLVSFEATDLACDYIIHAGCPTASRYFMDHPVETAATIVDGTRNMLELARISQCKSFAYISSMEVYGNGNAARGLDGKLTEADVGHVDPLSMRSCYPEGKRMAELLTCAYLQEYGVPGKVIRLAQTFGAGIPLDDKRVFAQFARCAMRGEDIVLHTTGESTRMYVYPTDAVAAIFTVLLNGACGEAYNVANETTYSSVREMAEMVAREFSSGRSAVRIEVDPEAPYPPEHHLPLDTAALEALGWRPEIGFGEMYRRLIAYLEPGEIDRVSSIGD